MKLAKWLSIVAGLQLLAVYPAHGDAAGTAIKMNGQIKELQEEQLLLNGRTLLAAEDVAALMQGRIKNGPNGQVSLVVANQTITFKPGLNQFSTGEKWTSVDQGAVRREATVYLPLRVVMEETEHTVSWNPQSQLIEIAEKKGVDSFMLKQPEQLTDEERTFAEGVKKEQGIYHQGNFYVIARGQSPNPGYGLRFAKAEEKGEQLLVYVQLTKPEPGKMYPQMIVYPYLAANIELSRYKTVTFLDADTGKPLFS
ncbi:stalk domain-containing protein [Brevibacillus fulvus]|uniref:Protease complex subunit PrcB family protein n=1 Tax=Brevibacillus fulvus TaxID=1125967 RepID=A0A938Y337_9BACL|nr:protease complex subunit PrcB family protein [Brevibacillus fulvus]MBM7590742.1 hypothetical protein [Brevibacillus fulvus]